MQEMTIARGLTRLKTIKAQIGNNNKLLQGAVISSKDMSTLANSKQSLEKNHAEAKKTIAETLQQNKDLIAEFISIRTNIARTNDVTTITIAGKAMTISEAMLMRHDIKDMYENMLSAYASSTVTANRKVEKYNQTVLSGSASDKDKEILTAQIVSFVDPKEFEELNAFQTTFMAELNGTLNEANAVTRFTME